MNILEFIKQRRSIGKMTQQCPTREQIEQLLEAAIHAPNHHKAEPWRFTILAGSAREELGVLMQEALRARMAETDSEAAQAQLKKERSKPMRSPVVIVVASEHPQQPNVVDIENVEAVSAAVENMLLVAEEMGLAAMWRTGDATNNLAVKKWLGLAPEDHIVAFLYLGFPAIPRIERQPIPFVAKTEWRGWEDLQQGIHD